MRRPLLLNGFMTTGKSTVGKLVAKSHDFIDLDVQVERDAGASVSEIFATRGEAAFRALERDTLRALLADGKPRVIALGGGALLDRALRLEALDRGVVVTLDATADEVVRRAASSNARPLLEVEDPRARAESLMSDRRLAYAECHARIATTGRDPADVARDVLAVWHRDPIAVAAGTASYTVDIGHGFAAGQLVHWVAGASMALVVTDENVRPHHAGAIERSLAGAGIRSATVVLEPGEAHKNLASIERIWDTALTAGLDRKSRIVALGGGVVTDMAGFAAATWMRGIPWIVLPTTLLAMVDASVGGKTAIDLRAAKNAVGAFWQPAAVLCDVAHLATEPERGYRSALAEVVKTALIGDAALLDFVETHAPEILARVPDAVSEIVRRCVRVKARVVGLDEREDGLRACLNLGHTIGHALEAHAGYGALPHGEAVSLGLVAALRIGERLGTTDRALTERCVRVQAALGLPVDLASQPIADAVALVGHDKKRAGSRIRFVVARAPGDVVFVELGLSELREHALSLVKRGV